MQNDSQQKAHIGVVYIEDGKVCQRNRSAPAQTWCADEAD